MEKFIGSYHKNQPPNALLSFFEKVSRYDDILNLSVGDFDLPTPPEIIDAMYEGAKAGFTKYGNPWGDPELRNEIVNVYKEDYNFDIKQENVYITVAGCSAMTLTMTALGEPGDEVLIFDPYFASYKGQVELGGKKPVFVPCYENEGWKPNMERAAEYLTDRTVGMIVNTPNNPTAVCYSIETLQEIADFAKKHDICVVADDIYTDFIYDGVFTPIASLPGMFERTITINSFSKNFAMTGFRVGNIVGENCFLQAVKTVSDSMVFTAPAANQRAAIYALRNRKALKKQVAEVILKRGKLAKELFSKLNNFSLGSAQGSIYLFPSIKETGLSSSEVADIILEQAHILILPGIAFGKAGEGYLRIALTVSEEKIQEAYDRLSKLDIFK